MTRLITYIQIGHGGANAGFDPNGAVVKFKNGNHSISFRIKKIRELFYNTTTLENFPVLPDRNFGLSKDDDDDHHNFDKFPSLKFSLTSIQNLTVGKVLFEHLIVSASPIPGTKISIHLFVALNSGIAQIWDKNYTFTTGSFKFSIEIDNWKFCSGCVKATSKDPEVPHTPRDRHGRHGGGDDHMMNRYLRAAKESGDDSHHGPIGTTLIKHYDANVLDIQIEFVSSTLIEFAGDDDSERNCTILHRPDDYHHIRSNRSLVSLPSDYVVNGVPAVMYVFVYYSLLYFVTCLFILYFRWVVFCRPYGFPVVDYDSKYEGTVTFRFNKFNGTLYYDPVADVNKYATPAADTPPISVSNPSPSSSDAGCFAGTETVEMLSGQMKSIADIKVGDVILAANKLGVTSYSEVVAVPHGANSATANFIQFTTKSGHSVKMTADHIVLVSDCDSSSGTDLVTAKSVKSGTCLLTTTGKQEVTAVETMILSGLYTVVTKEEFVVVNGVLASPFAVNHAVTHAFYNLHRAVYHFFPQWMKTMNGESIIARTGQYIESLVPV